MMTASKLIDSILASGDIRMQWSPEYAEPGYDCGERGILFANWNSNTRWDKELHEHVTIDEIMPRIANIAEHLGYEIEWSDEWSTCSDCGRAMRTEPDWWGWEPSYRLGDGEILCTDCHEPPEDV